MSDRLAGDTTDRLPRRRFLAATGAVGAALLAGCSGGGDSDGGGDGGSGGGTPTPESMNTPSESMDGTATESMDGGAASASWRTMELTTVRGGETFTVGGFDRPVVLETFAVWCPKCKRQQQELANLGDSVVPISLNTDPNEDAEVVRKHAEENGFDWRYAVAPSAMTASLIDEFGPTVTNAPSTPVIVVCPGGSAQFMSGSISSAADIEAAAGEC